MTKRAGEAFLGDLVSTITERLKKGERVRIAGLQKYKSENGRPAWGVTRDRRSNQNKSKQEGRIPGSQGFEDGGLVQTPSHA